MIEFVRWWYLPPALLKKETMSIDQMIADYKMTVDAHRATEAKLLDKIMGSISPKKVVKPSKKAAIEAQVRTARNKKLLKKIGNNKQA